MYDLGSILHFEEWYVKNGKGMPKYGIVLNDHNLKDMLLVITSSQPYVDPDQNDSCFYKAHEFVGETHYYTFWSKEEISEGDMTCFPKDTHLFFGSSVYTLDVTGSYNNTIGKGPCVRKGVLKKPVFKALLTCALLSNDIPLRYKEILTAELAKLSDNP